MHTYGPPPKKKVGAEKKREAQQFVAPLAGHAGKSSGGETERGQNKKKMQEGKKGKPKATNATKGKKNQKAEKRKNENDKNRKE